MYTPEKMHKHLGTDILGQSHPLVFTYVLIAGTCTLYIFLHTDKVCTAFPSPKTDLGIEHVSA